MALHSDGAKNKVTSAFMESQESVMQEKHAEFENIEEDETRVKRINIDEFNKNQTQVKMESVPTKFEEEQGDEQKLKHMNQENGAKYQEFQNFETNDKIDYLSQENEPTAKFKEQETESKHEIEVDQEVTIKFDESEVTEIQEEIVAVHQKNTAEEIQESGLQEKVGNVNHKHIAEDQGTETQGKVISMNQENEIPEKIESINQKYVDEVQGVATQEKSENIAKDNHEIGTEEKIEIMNCENTLKFEKAHGTGSQEKIENVLNESSVTKQNLLGKNPYNLCEMDSSGIALTKSHVTQGCHQCRVKLQGEHYDQNVNNIIDIIETQYYCIPCKMELINSNQVEKHITRSWHQKNINLELSEENESGRKEVHLKNHIIEVKVDKYYCIICEVDFYNIDEHFRNCCRKCKIEDVQLKYMIVPVIDSVLDHCVSDVTLMKFQCLSCKEILEDEINMNKHINESLCSEKFKGEMTLASDLNTKDKAADLIAFKNNKKGKKLPKVETLSRDEQEIYMEQFISDIKVRQYYCNICELSLAGKKALEMHMAASCHHCKMAEQNDMAQMQLENMREDKESCISKTILKEYSCELCKVKLRDARSVKKHTTTAFHCRKVRRYFSENEKSNKHFISEREVVLYSCSKCNLRFNILEKHLEKYCHKCKVMTQREIKSKPRREVDEDGMMYITEKFVTKFRCLQCNTLFKNKFKLRKHQEVVHDTKKLRLKILPEKAVEFSKESDKLRDTEVEEISEYVHANLQEDAIDDHFESAMKEVETLEENNKNIVVGSYALEATSELEECMKKERLANECTNMINHDFDAKKNKSVDYMKDYVYEIVLNKYFCSLCKVYLNNVTAKKKHLQKHCHVCLTKTKIREDNDEPVMHLIKQEDHLQKYMQEVVVSRYFCKICNVSVGNLDTAMKHTHKYKHRKAVSEIVKSGSNDENFLIEEKLPKYFCKLCKRHFFQLELHLEIRCHKCLVALEMKPSEEKKNDIMENLVCTYSISHYQCMLCRKVMRLRSHLRRHMKRHKYIDKMNIGNCPTAEDKESENTDQGSEVKDKTEDSSKVQEKKRGKSRPQILNLVEQYICQKNIQQYFCRACNTHLANNKTKKEHMAKQGHLHKLADMVSDNNTDVIQKITRLVFHCQTCKIDLKNLKKAKKHVGKFHIAKKNVGYSVGEKDDDDAQKEEVKRMLICLGQHITEVSVRKHVCKLCNINTFSEFKMDRHIKSKLHKGKVATLKRNATDITFSCDCCVFYCTLCDQKLYNFEMGKKHIRRKEHIQKLKEYSPTEEKYIENSRESAPKVEVNKEIVKELASKTGEQHKENPTEPKSKKVEYEGTSTSKKEEHKANSRESAPKEEEECTANSRESAPKEEEHKEISRELAPKEEEEERKTNSRESVPKEEEDLKTNSRESAPKEEEEYKENSRELAPKEKEN